MSDWISVKDRLPTAVDADENGKVLIYRKMNSEQLANCKTVHDYAMVKYCDEYTMWLSIPPLPLPEPPKDEPFEELPEFKGTMKALDDLCNVRKK